MWLFAVSVTDCLSSVKRSWLKKTGGCLVKITDNSKLDNKAANWIYKLATTDRIKRHEFVSKSFISLHDWLSANQSYTIEMLNLQGFSTTECEGLPISLLYLINLYFLLAYAMQFMNCLFTILKRHQTPNNTSSTITHNDNIWIIVSSITLLSV